MAAPNRGNKKRYLGSNPVPTNDTGDIGGAINTSTAIDENVVGNTFGDLRTSESGDVQYYTIFYSRMEQTSPGTLQNARVAHRSGARLNASAGAATLVSTSTTDTGRIRIVGKVDGDWVTENVTLNGTTPVNSTNIWDSNTATRWEAIDGVPVGAVTCSISSSICAVIWGTGLDPTDGFPSIATYMASAEFDFAVADDINTTLSSDDRLTAPSGISSFSKATRWSGEDFSIAVPGDELGANDYIGICVRFTAFEGIPAPANGKMQFKDALVGDASA